MLNYLVANTKGVSMTRKNKKRDIAAKEESLLDHQGITSFKGSGYKGKGNLDHDKSTHNKKRR